ncbi:MAG: sensor histidine kinase [Chitinophagaceae bacterium]
MLKLPRYSRNDLFMLLWAVLPLSLIINFIIFENAYFSDLLITVAGTLITFSIIGITFLLYRAIGKSFRQRFPRDSDFFKRTMLLIFFFLLMSALVILGLFSIYVGTGLLQDKNYENKFTWAYLVVGIVNIFFAFLNEGIFSFERWKNELNETENLKMAYKQSQLMGLKSQVNPHFLFNSLNSLSGLIQEDTAKAEKFLDEMSRVYRYMLRNEETQLVQLAVELQFIRSYFSLLKARYNEAVELQVDINEDDKEKLVPPLSLQVIIENALFQNKTAKDSPLVVRLASDDGEAIIITNNVQRKVMTEIVEYEAGLDNLVKRYQLMNQPPVKIEEEATVRRIRLPLIRQTEEVIV